MKIWPKLLIVLSFLLSTMVSAQEQNTIEQAKYDAEVEAQLLNALIKMATLDEHLQAVSLHGADELNEYLYHFHNDTDVTPSSSLPFLSLYGDGSTTITADLGILLIGFVAEYIVVNKSNVDGANISSPAVIVLSSIGGLIRDLSPSSHTSILGEREKAIFSEAANKRHLDAREYAKNIGIIFELTPAEQKIIEKDAYQYMMDNFYRYAPHSPRHDVDAFNVFEVLKSHSIALEKVQIMEDFLAYQKAYEIMLKEKAYVAGQDQELLKKQLNGLKTKKDQISATIKMIEAREAYNTDPELQKEIQKLKEQVLELQAAYELDTL
ncbi:MAG: hypothetical protein JNM93_05035 [Bacteriovoracaceae bacterium]|nr:hypothetical protein [Bacteriovoracaceae bacterium]